MMQRSNNKKIALLTCAQYIEENEGDWYTSQIHREENLLSEALLAYGYTTERVDWSDPTINWSAFDAAVFRSTLDYFYREREFSQWLNRVRGQTRLLNDVDLVFWNMDKHYLSQLNRAGIPIVETRFIEKGEKGNLKEIATEAGWNEIIIKPAISGGARLTYRIRSDEIPAMQEKFDQCIAEEAMLIQPFRQEITDTGEISIMVMNGEVTHAVRKTAKSGDFRVQDDHGGVAEPIPVQLCHADFALQVVSACPEAPVYARVDFIDSSKGPLLMELELIEPELFLRHAPESAKVLANGIRTRLEDGIQLPSMPNSMLNDG
jgi:glutathione synthase/RimK-type ligase-like ATP-grasp enzyme